MIKMWKLIIETYDALPEAERTSQEVHSKLLEQGYSLGIAQVQEVLDATVLSRVLSPDDVRVTARTLNILLGDRPHPYCEKLVLSTINTDYAEGLTKPLKSIAGRSASDLAQALERLVADYDAHVEVAGQLNYIEMIHELEKHRNDGPVF